MKDERHVECLSCESRAKNIFCQIDKSLADQLSNSKSTRIYKKKQILYYEESPALGIYCVKSGKIKVYKTNPEGKLHILRIANAGDVLGLESLFAGDKYSSTAEMLEEGAVCFISREFVMDLVRRDPRVSLHVMEALAAEVVESERVRIDLAQSSVRERMARLLVILARSHGISAKGLLTINLPLSREEMAEMVGTAAETAMRLLKEFREDKIVEVHGKEIVILDRRRLEQTANIVA